MRRFLLLTAVALAAAAAPASAQEPPAPEQQSAAVTTAVPVTGHGYGHGRGMGQYGAYGYAIDHGWTWQQITDHFYGGTTLGTVENRTIDVLLKGYGTGWTVAFLETGTLVTSLDGQLPGGPDPNRRAVAVEWLPGTSTFRLWEGTTCAGMNGGPFVDRGVYTADEVVIATADPAPDQRVELIAACEANGHRYYRGALVADAFATSTQPIAQRTMNRVDVESYLRSVVPAESPASWGGSNGTGPGMHALRAQAVAARSYALAGDSRNGEADTCDDIFCQVYRGYGFNAGGQVTLHEARNTDIAVADTAGVVRRMPNGSLARTEFSSSTGGYTAGGTFPAVPDEGDDVAANPNHNWSVTIPVESIESGFDGRAGRDLGAFQGFEVLARNELGADGGRVLRLVGRFARGELTVTGDQFRSMFSKHRVLSDWFVVPTGTAPAGRFSDTAGNAHADNIEKIADAGIAGGFADGTFRPNDPVSRAQMATFLAEGYDLPAASSPTFPDIGGDVHAANIRAIAAAGITTGDAQGNYRPTEPVTRGQMAAFLARAEELDLDDDGDSSLCDVDEHLFAAEIRVVVDAGIAAGAADGCFHPDDPVTRGQMATFLARALGL